MGSNSVVKEEEEEEYINMELASSPSKSPQLKEFEFQFFSAPTPDDSAADELFYKGKLLPLHLPPRRQMVEHLLRTAPCTNSNTPSDSRNISPSESRRVSCDLTAFEWPTEINSFLNNHQPIRSTATSWSKKLKMKRSILAHKLKSFFTKSDPQNLSSKPDLAVKYSRFGKRFATLMKRNGIDDHRRSFSGAISADFSTTTTNCSSSSSTASSSFNLSGLHELQFLRRSSSAAEIEVSINAAIAHCKKSMIHSSFSSS
ncbi:probable membrane-associated kinase regulator 4 [Salvia splendens]|uniref:probable membrane-associated kinase regulator 4 n=1 Tax=Salvia splendens TaxID=180675 RepID=UPI001C264994|nr:probable membrane-associated kinase regulator 4 [Salvia splendens]